MAYRPELVARIKGALQSGFGPKLLARITGIPIDTIKVWSSESRRGDVEADRKVADDVRDVLYGRFSGRESES